MGRRMRIIPLLATFLLASGKACGDRCIARRSTCSEERGCARDG